MRRVSWRVLVVCGVLQTACLVDPAQYTEGSCQSDADCVQGRTCDLLLSRCGGTAGGGGNPDSGGACVRWRQAIQGFATTDDCPGCTVTVDAAQNKDLTSSFGVGAAPVYAYATLPPSAFISSAEGQIRGTLRILSGDVDDPSTFFEANAGALTVLQLLFSNNFELGANTSAGVLQSTDVRQLSGSVDFLPDTDYLFDVSWRRGSHRTVRVNGTVVLNRAITTPFTGGGETLTSVRLGILNYAGSTSGGWSFSGWEICDTASGLN